MDFKNFVYILLLSALFLATLGASIKRKDGFWGKLRYLFPAMLFTGIIFAIWDIRFAELGIWSFNPGSLTGISLRNLPLEEWLSFFVLPFFSVYVYESLKNRPLRFAHPNIFVALSLVLLAAYASTAYFFRQGLYTFFTFFLLSVYFGYTIFRNNFKKDYPRFYLSFLFALVPFFILRWVLTTLPVVSFNSRHILNVFIFSVPIEDIGYFFLMHLMNVTIFEYLRAKQFY